MATVIYWTDIGILCLTAFFFWFGLYMCCAGCSERYCTRDICHRIRHKMSKPFMFATYTIRKVKREGSTMSPTIFTIADETVPGNPDITTSVDSNEVDDIKLLVNTLWDPTFIGIGKDARGLIHKGVDIIDILRINVTDKVENGYRNKKKEIENFAEKVGRLKAPENIMNGAQPVATSQVVQQLTQLKQFINGKINEVYLFHGTSSRNLSSIGHHGLVRSTDGLLGGGIYFTDSPVKADQYAKRDDKDGSYCMLLSRVILGDIAIVRRSNVAAMRGATRPPCRKCFRVKPLSNGRCTCKHVCDSVCLEGGLFREYVVFDEALVLPEYLIQYKRVKSS